MQLSPFIANERRNHYQKNSKSGPWPWITSRSEPLNPDPYPLYRYCTPVTEQSSLILLSASPANGHASFALWDHYSCFIFTDLSHFQIFRNGPEPFVCVWGFAFRVYTCYCLSFRCSRCLRLLSRFVSDFTSITVSLLGLFPFSAMSHSRGQEHVARLGSGPRLRSSLGSPQHSTSTVVT